jgi:hypothetical protein
MKLLMDEGGLGKHIDQMDCAFSMILVINYILATYSQETWTGIPSQL